jgi:hypothetical protein
MYVKTEILAAVCVVFHLLLVTIRRGPQVTHRHPHNSCSHARSAPTNPGVRAAMADRSTAGERVTGLGVDPQHQLPALQIWAVERHLAVPGSAVAAATAACFLTGEPEDAGMRGLD